MQGEGRQYRVMHVLGRGGFGTVYRAEMLGGSGFTRPVALKVLNPEVANVEDVAGRLRDEARLLGLLRHRAIVQVDSLILLDGHWAVVMEFVDGVDLRRLISRCGPVPAGAALEIAQEVASALHAAYDRPVPSRGRLHALHRDIKPSNIQITRAGEVKVLDFGVARAEFDTREAKTHSLVFGSTGYIAPERLFGIDTHAGDVYSLGVVLYESIAGAHLGALHREPGGFSAQVQAAIRPIRTATHCDGLADLLAECLSFEAENRPTAADVERRIRALRPSFAEPWLADWADEKISGFSQDCRDGQLSGRVLTEHMPRLTAPAGGALSPPPASEPASQDGAAFGGPAASTDATPLLPDPEDETRAGAGAEADAATLVLSTGDGPIDSSSIELETVASAEATGPAGTVAPPGAVLPDTAWTKDGPSKTPVAGRKLRLSLVGAAALATMAGVAATLAGGREFFGFGPPEASSDGTAPVDPSAAQGDATDPGDATATAANGDPTAGDANTATGDPAAGDATGDGAGNEGAGAPQDPAPTPGRKTGSSGNHGTSGHPAGSTQPDQPPSGSEQPAPPATATGRVTVTGDPARINLHGKAGDFPPGQVPAGTYSATIDFVGGGASSLSSVQVVAGRTTVLECDVLFSRCKARQP
jgi:serine/threonine protein kinase